MRLSYDSVWHHGLPYAHMDGFIKQSLVVGMKRFSSQYTQTCKSNASPIHRPSPLDHLQHAQNNTDGESQRETESL